MSSEPLEQRIWMDAPVAEAWQAWIDEERITQWFAPSARIEAWAGGAFDLYFETAAASRERRRGCRILEIVPQEKLVFQWKGPTDFASFMNAPEPQTVVTVLFSPEGEGTRLQLIHTGWGEGEDWKQARSWHELAWPDVLEALKHMLEESAEEMRQMQGEEAEDDMELDLGMDYYDVLGPSSRERRESAFSKRPAAPGPRPPAAPPTPSHELSALIDHEEDEEDENKEVPPTARGAQKPVKAAPRPAKRAAEKPATSKPAAKKTAVKKAAAKPVNKSAAKKAPKKRAAAKPAKKRPEKKAKKKSAARSKPVRGRASKPARKAVKRKAAPKQKSAAKKRPAPRGRAGKARRR